MAEYSTPEERTEMPTDRRMGQLRRQGAIFHSTEVVTAVSLLTSFSVLSMLWGSLMTHMQMAFVKAFKLIANAEDLTVEKLQNGFYGIVLLIGPDILILAGTTAFAASLAVLIQTDFNIKEHKIEFKFNLLNPWSGITRIFSMAGLVNTLKALFKLLIILPLSYILLKDLCPGMVGLMRTSLDSVFHFTGQTIMMLFWRIFYILIGFALFDFAWGKYQWLRQNKMTKEEVKDERKSVEGDEDTKRRIQAKGLQRIAQRIRDSIRKADVVVTNPTHYAVALRYDKTKMDAPMVVAKGQGYLALRIREMAKEFNVPVLERKPLARALYASVEVGSSIPRELFKAVAEVLAYVYRLKNPWKYMQQNNATAN